MVLLDNNFNNKTSEQKKNLAYLAIFAFIMLLYHVILKVNFGDEVNYFSKQLDKYNLFEWLFSRYNKWSSRLIIEAMLVCLSRNLLTVNIVLWKVLDFGFWMLLAYSLYKLSHKVSLFALFILLLIYPFRDMAATGWMATTLNYLWPLSLELYSLIALDKLSRGEKISLRQVIFSLVAAVIGVNAEQSCGVHMGMLILYTFYAVSNRNTHMFWLFVVHYVITFGMLIFIFTCPGNYQRILTEIRYMPEFYEKNKLDMLIDGFGSTISQITYIINLLFLVFSCFLFCCVCKKTKVAKYRIISGFPLAVAFLSIVKLLFDVLKGMVAMENFSVSSLYPIFKFKKIWEDISVTAENWMLISSYLPFIIYILTITCIVLAFFIIFDDVIKSLECTYIFLLLLVSRVVMGFTPSLYASGIRTFFFFYGLLIFLILRMYEHCSYLFSRKEIRIAKYSSLVLLVGMVMFNIISTYMQGLRHI